MAKAKHDTDEVDPITQILIVTFCDRLTQIIDRRPDVVRKGRGRVNDFAAKFNIHYTTAHRLLEGKSLPSATLLCAIADKFEISESWLLGRGEPDVDVLLDKSSAKIQIFKPRSSEGKLFATIPISELPAGFDSSKLIYTRTVTERGREEDVIVKLMAEPSEGKVHLIYNPVDDSTYLRRINVLASKGDLLCFSVDTGATETLKAKDVVFGSLNVAKKLSVVGPVVARIRFGFKGD